MRILKYISLVLLICTAANAQINNSFHPSVYYTFGDYSNNTRSNSIAVYGKIDLKLNDYIAAGYDRLNIDNSEWYYDQNFFTIGGQKNLYPFYLKLNYALVDGTFDSKLFEYSYDDEIHLVNGSISYNIDYYRFGLRATYQSLVGFLSLNTTHSEIEIQWNPSRNFVLSFTPGYTYTTDDRSLYSVGGEIFYSPSKFMNLSLVGFLGQRVMYYNPDYMTFYSQYETQKSSGAAVIRLFTDKPVNLIFSGQYTDFTDYLIRYYSAGIKVKL